MNNDDPTISETTKTKSDIDWCDTLERYGNHDNDCPAMFITPFKNSIWTKETANCTCGFGELEAIIRDNG